MVVEMKESKIANASLKRRVRCRGPNISRSRGDCHILKSLIELSKAEARKEEYELESHKFDRCLRTPDLAPHPDSRSRISQHERVSPNVITFVNMGLCTNRRGIPSFIILHPHLDNTLL